MPYIRYVLYFIVIKNSITLSALPKKLQVLTTKQNIRDIRYIDNEDSITIYQNGSGKLYFSKNYTTNLLLNGPKDSFFTAQTSHYGKKIIITRDTQLYENKSSLKTLDIYLVDSSGDNLSKIGSGINPKLHLNDTFISYIIPIEKKITIAEINNKSNQHDIKLIMGHTLFIPTFHMITKNIFLLSHLSKNGDGNIFLYNLKNHMNSPLFQKLKPWRKIEVCSVKEQILIGIFPLIEEASETIIYMTKKKDLLEKKFHDFEKNNQKIFIKIYESKNSDIGNMICDQTSNELLFIKLFLDNERERYDVASLNLKTLKVIRESEIGFVTQIIQLHNRILLSHKGEYLIIRGKNNEKTSLRNKKNTTSL